MGGRHGDWPFGPLVWVFPPHGGGGAKPPNIPRNVGGLFPPSRCESTVSNPTNSGDRVQLLQLQSQENKVRPLEIRLSCLMDGFMTGKKNKDDSLLHAYKFCIGARWNFWWKRVIFGQHFTTTEALLSLLGLRNHWSTLFNEEIIAVSRIEAVCGPGRCYLLPFGNSIWPPSLVSCSIEVMTQPLLSLPL